MLSFGQYVTTRRLRQQPLASRSPKKDTNKTSNLETHAGVDAITGIPVLIYTFPGTPPNVPNLNTESLPRVLETGKRDDLGFMVVSTLPGSVPLRPTLSQTRCEWLLRQSSRALCEAHSNDLVHGHLCPEHFYAQGTRLFIDGWGLPWEPETSPYHPTKTTHATQTQRKADDVYAWARCMQVFVAGENKPEAQPQGPLGALLEHCLHPNPTERPTATELLHALEQVLNDPNLSFVVAPRPDASNPEPHDGPEQRAETPEASATLGTDGLLSERPDLAADEPDVIAPSPDVDNEPHIFARNTDPIRIGFDGDESWRTITTPPPKANWTLTRLGVGVLGTLALVVVALAFWWFVGRAPTNSSTPTASLVTFKLEGGQGRTGSLLVLEAPSQAKLTLGATLAEIPGPVAFPVPGAYKLQIVFDGLERSETTLVFPQDNNRTVTLKLPTP